VRLRNYICRPQPHRWRAKAAARWGWGAAREPVVEGMPRGAARRGTRRGSSVTRRACVAYNARAMASEARAEVTRCASAQHTRKQRQSGCAPARGARQQPRAHRQWHPRRARRKRRKRQEEIQRKMLQTYEEEAEGVARVARVVRKNSKGAVAVVRAQRREVSPDNRPGLSSQECNAATSRNDIRVQIAYKRHAVII